MAPLAQAYVRLRADSTVLAAEATRDASVAGERAGLAMGRSMSTGMTRTFKALIGLGAATGLVEVGKKVLDLADKFEAARASAEQNTDNIGVAFKSVEKPLGDLDSKMSALGFTITDTEGAFSQLVTATRDPAKAMRDVALAADIARGRHISLGEATQILMRVETGHVAMLGRLGIATRNANGSIFTQQQALDALAGAYGGNASKFAGTFAGKQAVARAEIQQSATEIGVALLPALADMATILSHDVLPPLASAAQFFDKNRKTIEPLVAILGGAVLAWKAYSLATKAAAAANVLFAGSAVGAEGAAVAETAALASRAKLLGFGGALAGGALLYGGSKVGGQAGGVMTATGAGALAGSMFGPEGALVGATGGAVYGLTTNVLNDTFGKPGAGKPDPTAGFTPAFKKQVDALGGVDKALAFYRAQNAKTQASQQAVIQSWDQTAAAAHRTADALINAAQKNIAVASAQDGLRQAFRQGAQTAADSGRALKGNSDAALANRAALENEATAIFSVIDAMKKHGASAAAQNAALSVLEQALETNATLTYGDKAAVDSLLSSLGLLPQAVNVAAQALATLPTVAQNEITDGTISPGAIHQLNLAVTKAKAQGTKLGESFTSGYTPAVAKGADKAAKAAESAMQKAMDAAKQKMETDFSTINDFLTSTKSSLAQFADLSNNATRTDALGTSGPALSLQSFLKDRAAKLKVFAGLFTRLDRAGLDPRLMQQFAQAGPDAIPAMQQLLASGGRGIRQVNSLERQIDSYATRVAREDTALQQSSLIHKDLTSLPPKFASALAKELKGIRVITDRGKLDARNGATIVALS